MIRLYDKACRQGDLILIPVSLNEFEVRHMHEVRGSGFYDTRNGELYAWGHKGEHGDHAHVLKRAVVQRTYDSEHMQPVNLVRIEAVSEALRHIALKNKPGDTHNTLEVPEGLYEVRVQRSWKATPDPETQARVSYRGD